MFFHFQCIPFIIIGIVCVVFSNKIANFMLRLSSVTKWNKQPYKSLLFVWPFRFIGIICLGISFWIFSSGPSMVHMNRDENKVILLEDGKITEAKIQKSYYKLLASEGWIVVYKFTCEDPKTNKGKTYFGSSQGPKKYYDNLNKGDVIDIIYYPQKPKINSEIRCFLNNPNYRDAFTKAGKLDLLKKFKNRYTIEDYSFDEWYRQQRTR